jgi:hypothetical protein
MDVGFVDNEMLKLLIALFWRVRVRLEDKCS